MTTVAVIGGGIVGSAAAVWLLAEGFDVTVFERDPDARPASTGNAGILNLPEISPLARPSILASVPGWLLDPLGPLTLRARDLPALTPWLARFVYSARPSQVARATAALGFIMKTALIDHQELARRAGLPIYMRRNGSIYLYDTDAIFRSALSEWKERARYGVDYREVTVAEARAMVPALKGGFERALLTPDQWSVTSPLEILQGLRSVVSARGRLLTATIDAVRPDGDKVTVAAADGTASSFDRVVIAGGVWSRDLVRKLGLRVLLEAERGYNTTFADPGFSLDMSVFFSAHGFVASPLNDGLRIGGAVELAAVDAPPNFERARAMRAKARRYFPDLPETGGKEWMGARPATPDSMAVIGPHPQDPRIVFAFGHGHLGLTLSAATARHVTALVGGRREPGLVPFGIERFQ
ncbi:MAG TPA: FAD-dependent oxidoreductase [Bauldia sp.]